MIDFAQICFFFLKVSSTIFGGFLWVFQPIMIVFCTSIVSFLVFAGFAIGIPLHHEKGRLFISVTAILLVYFGFCSLFNYYMTIFVGPGRPQKSLLQEDSLNSGKKRFCNKCKAPKPPRSHHCRLCRKCVLKMDHHCPWVANCVGYKNHKHFYLFLGNCFFGAGFVSYLTWRAFRGASTTGSPYNDLIPDNLLFASSLAFILSSSGCISVSFLFIWHTYLLLTNQSTIEFYLNRVWASEAKRANKVFRNDYDLGWKRNLKEAFGDKFSLLVYFLVPMKAKMPGDGCVYRTQRNPNLRKMSDVTA